MSEKRASKKQREVLEYIAGFITDNGFGPSYREVMKALNYKSVSTVAAHVDELIARGYLRKRENSARSLEVVSMNIEPVPVPTKSTHIAWLKEEIAQREANPERANETDILKAALSLLDQTEEK